MNIDIDKLDNLPLRENRASHIVNKYGSMWFILDKRNKDKSKSPWAIAERIAKKYIGKNYDRAFSEYCKLVRYDAKYIFYKENFSYKGINYPPKYIIDKQNRIQVNKKWRSWRRERNGVWFMSADYEVGYVHKITGEVIDKDEYQKRKYKYDKHKGEWVNNKYAETVISGFYKWFESKKDPEYIRLMLEDAKKQRLLRRNEKKQSKNSDYSFLTKDEKRIKELGKLYAQKIQLHGFKGDGYHGQQRKKIN